MLLILVLLLLLPFVERSNPFWGKLRGELLVRIAPLSPSLAQQSTSTLALQTPLFNPNPTLEPTVGFTPTGTPTMPEVASTQKPSMNLLALTEGWLILSLLDGDYYHLFAFQPDRLQWLQLTEGQWDDIHPAVSPDGQWIAFSSNRNRYWDLFVLSLQDGQIIPLTRSPQYDGSPTWSPDGKWLAYESYLFDPLTQEGNLEILIQPVNLGADPSQQVVQLTSAKGADFSPRWSPRGRQIALISQRAGENDLWIADLDQIDDRYRNLSGESGSAVQSLCWSADGRWLLWNTAHQGVQWIYRWDADAPHLPPRKVMTGGQPILTHDGAVIFSVLTTPHEAYLQAVSLEDGRLRIPLTLLPSKPQGMAWLPINIPEPLASAYQPLSNINGHFPLQQDLSQKPLETMLRQRLKPLDEVKAPFPYLHENVLEAFQALRKAVEQRAGWDYLSRLENAYLPLSSPSFPSLDDEWLYTGRAIALEASAINVGWLVVGREEYGAEIYWRLYLKTRYQDGSQGMPLRDLPFDLNARYSGNALAYDNGGAWMPEAPTGYWIDLTDLAQRYGWQRLPALASWRTALPNARATLLIKRDQLDWYTAMLELYPAEALYTPTAVPSPTQTPTRTLIPTRTPTATQTPRPTVTPRVTISPFGSPTISSTP